MKLSELSKEKRNELTSLKTEEALRAALEDIELDEEQLNRITGGTGSADGRDENGNYNITCFLCGYAINGSTPEALLQAGMDHAYDKHPKECASFESFIRFLLGM